MNQMTSWVWNAALSLSLSNLIDGFLDWIDQLNDAMALAPIQSLAGNDMPKVVLRD